MKKIQSGDKPMLPWYGKLFYGSGALSYGAVAQTGLGLLMLFATDARNMPGWLAGIALAIGFMFAAAAEPLTAYLSDRTRSLMFGRRFGYILPGIFLTAFLNIILFAMPADIHAVVKFLWLTVFASLLNIALSALSAPHSALADELAGGKAESQALTAARKVFFLIALAVPTVLLGILIPDTKNAAGYTDLALINSSLVLISGLLCFFAAYPHLPRLNAKTEGAALPKLTFKQIFGGFFKALSEKSLRYIVLGYTVSMMSVAFLTGAGLHFLRYTMNFSVPQTAGALSALFAFAVFSQPLWVRLSKKYDKKGLILSGTITALAGIFLICLIFSLHRYAGVIQGPFWFFAAAMAIIGAGSGAMHAMPLAMLTGAGGGSRNIGRQSGLMSFMFKASQAAVMLLAGILLTAFGFSGAAPVQSELTKDALGWIAVLGSSLALGAAVYLYMKAGAKPKKKPEDNETKPEDLEGEPEETEEKPEDPEEKSKETKEKPENLEEKPKETEEKPEDNDKPEGNL